MVNDVWAHLKKKPSSSTPEGRAAGRSTTLRLPCP
jgi:hypothetical protein